MKAKKDVFRYSEGAGLVLSFRNRTHADRKKKADKYECRRTKGYQS